MSGWAWLIWTGVCIGAALATLAGGLLLAFAIAGQRRVAPLSPSDEPHGRCDCCGYRLEGLESGLCPECGWAYANNRRLPMFRRLRSGVAGACLLLLAVAGMLTPQLLNRGVVSMLPDAVLIAIMPLAPGGQPGTQGAGACTNIEFGSAIHRALQSRLDGGGLDAGERKRLASKCAAVIAGERDDAARAAAARLLLSVAADSADSATRLLTGLDDPSPLVRGRVLTALGMLAAHGAPGRVQELIVQRLLGAAVCDRDECARKHAIDALGRLAADAPGAAGVYARAARDPSPAVRIRTMYALCLRPASERDDDGRLAALMSGTHDPHAGVREAAVYAMSRLAERRSGAVLLLALSLRDESHEIRELAAAALAKLGRRAAPAWTSLLAQVDDEDPDVQRAVMTALTAIGS